MTALVPIANNEIGLSVRTKLNALIAQFNTPLVFPAGGGTTGSVVFIGSGGAIVEDNANLFWDDAANNLILGGQLKLKGATSGTVSLTTAAAAGTWTLQLPTTPGTANYFLQTDGTGITTWAAGGSGGGGGMAIGGAVTGGTLGSVLFINPGGILAQDNSKFFWDDTNYSLKLGDSGTTASLYIDAQPALYRVANAGGDNWFEGGAGNFTVTGDSNFGTGAGALASLTTGQHNTAIGIDALQFCTTGFDNLAIGYHALQNETGGFRNFALGGTALQLCNGGQNNVAVGIGALSQLTTHSQNVAIGRNALFACDSSNNVGIGDQTLLHLTTGGVNVAIGPLAFQAEIDGSLNVGIGYSCGSSNTSGNWNTFIGTFCGNGITSTSSQNTIIGPWSPPTNGVYNNIIALVDGSIGGSGNVTGVDYNMTTSHVWSFQYSTTPIGLHVYNTTDGATHPTNYERGVFDWNITSNVLTIGTQAGGTGVLRDVRYYTGGKPAIFRVSNGTGDNWFEDNAGNFTLTGNSNFGTGDGSLSALTTGSGNTAMGNSAAASITTGGRNTAIGRLALNALTTGSDNFGMGSQSVGKLISGNQNIGIGLTALGNILTDDNNIGIGGASGTLLSSGTQNIFIGASAGQALTSGNQSVYIGALASYFLGSGSGNTIVGTDAVVYFTSGDNNTCIGRWQGVSAAVSNIITLTDGSQNLYGVDFNYTTSAVWSFQKSTTPIGLRVYNTTDGAAPPVNYERACLDWNLTSNIFRLASQAGGTGTVRLIAIDGFQKAGAPTAGDLPSTTWTVINDTSGGQTWLVYNNAGTIRKVQLV